MASVSSSTDGGLYNYYKKIVSDLEDEKNNEAKRHRESRSGELEQQQKI